jgi:hypothetical protein
MLGVEIVLALNKTQAPGQLPKQFGPNLSFKMIPRIVEGATITDFELFYN